MDVRASVDAAFIWVWTVLLLPARLLEESIHAVAAAPFAEQVLVRLTPRAGGPKTVVHYAAETPQWAKRLAHVAPELVAAAAAVATIAWWVLGGGIAWWPDSGLDWVLLWWVGVQYLAIAMPEQGGVDDAS